MQELKESRARIDALLSKISDLENLNLNLNQKIADLAQNMEDLKSALDDYAAGRYEDALKKLREYVASNPEDEEIFAVLRDADEKLLIEILTQQGEH